MKTTKSPARWSMYWSDTTGDLVISIDRGLLDELTGNQNIDVYHDAHPAVKSLFDALREEAHR